MRLVYLEFLEWNRRPLFSTCNVDYITENQDIPFR